MEILRNVMRANALFSALSGAMLLFGGAIWDEAMGLEPWFMAAVGSALLAYGVLLVWLGSRPDAVGGIRFATIMDLAWVLGAGVVLAGFPTAMTTTGRIALLTVSLVVAGFASSQMVGLRRTGSPIRPARSVA